MCQHVESPERFKVYLDEKDETLTSGLVSQTNSGIQKLDRSTEAGKLKLQGNKDQFLFISELLGDSGRNGQFQAGSAGRRESRREGGRIEKRFTPSSKDYQAC